jgi:hypothetical protein
LRCGRPTRISVCGRFLLYSSVDGQRAIFDTRGRSVIRLERLGQALPHVDRRARRWLLGE